MGGAGVPCLEVGWGADDREGEPGDSPGLVRGANCGEVLGEGR